MSEYNYQRQFQQLLRYNGFFVVKPPDYAGQKSKQADSLVFHNKPVLLEYKIWNRKNKDWNISADGSKKYREQLFAYQEKVKQGYHVFYIVWRKGKKHKNSCPDWVYYLNSKQFVTIKYLMSRLLEVCYLGL